MPYRLAIAQCFAVVLQQNVLYSIAFENASTFLNFFYFFLADIDPLFPYGKSYCHGAPGRYKQHPGFTELSVLFYLFNGSPSHFFQKIRFNLIQLVGQIHIHFLRIYKSSSFIPERIHLFFAQLLYLHY